MTDKVGVVVNPNALGVRRQRDLPARLRTILGRRGEVIETRTPADLARTADQFAAAGIGLVATCGGDGTNLATITEMVRAYGADRLPTFAILRGGTVNTVARNLHIAGDPAAILTRLHGWLVRGEEPPLVGQDLLLVNGLYGFLFASAMGARFLEAYYGGSRPGNAWAAFLAARTIASSLINGPFARALFSPVTTHLEYDDGVRPPPGLERPRLLLASTVPDVGIGMKVTWQGGRQPGRFHLVASNLSAPRMALQFHKVIAGRPLDGAPHLDVLVRRASIRFDEPQTYTLDGELFRSATVDLAVGPRLWIARP